MIDKVSLQYRRNELLTAAEKLVDTCIARKVDLAGAELTQYNGHIAEIKNIDAQLKRHAELAHFPEPGTVTLTGPTLTHL